jgi:5'-3' exonuclease
VYGIASEDMDSLTFGTPKLIRNLMKPQTQNLPINEYDYDKVQTFPLGLCHLSSCGAMLDHSTH